MTLRSEQQQQQQQPAKQQQQHRHLPEEAYKVSTAAIKTYPHSKKVGNYLIGRSLGQGSFAKVKEGMHVPTGEKVAVKIISKEKIKTDAYVRKNLRREGKILQQIRHPNVAQLLEILETENSYYLILELCRGGDMMDLIVKRTKLTEADTRRFLRQIVQAVDHMHRLGILHRDLKIENLLLTENLSLKIIDFGLSNLVKVASTEDGSIVSELCKTQCGSPAYAAPEVLCHKPYGTAVDVWSIGVNMFAMLTGNLPFTVKPFSIKGLRQKMLSGEMNQLPKDASRSCRDLLLRLLTPEPESRISLKDAMLHPWLQETGGEKLSPTPTPNRIVASDLLPDLLQFCCTSFGMKPAEITRHVIANKPGACLAAYQLLKLKVTRYYRQRGIATQLAPGESDAKTKDTNGSRAGDSSDRTVVSKGKKDTKADKQGTKADRQDTKADRQDTKADRQDTKADRQDTKAGRQDTITGREDTKAGRQDTKFNRQETAVDRQDTKSDRQKDRKDTKTDRQDTIQTSQSANASQNKDSCEVPIFWSKEVSSPIGGTAAASPAAAASASPDPEVTKRQLGGRASNAWAAEPHAATDLAPWPSPMAGGREQSSLDLSTSKERTVLAFITPNKERRIAVIDEEPTSSSGQVKATDMATVRANATTNRNAATFDVRNRASDAAAARAAAAVSQNQPVEYSVSTVHGKVCIPANSLPEVFLRHSIGRRQRQQQHHQQQRQQPPALAEASQPVRSRLSHDAAAAVTVRRAGTDAAKVGRVLADAHYRHVSQDTLQQQHQPQQQQRQRKPLLTPNLNLPSRAKTFSSR